MTSQTYTDLLQFHYTHCSHYSWSQDCCYLPVLSVSLLTFAAFNFPLRPSVTVSQLPLLLLPADNIVTPGHLLSSNVSENLAAVESHFPILLLLLGIARCLDKQAPGWGSRAQT